MVKQVETSAKSQKSKRFLGRAINISGRGKLSRRVGLPKWLKAIGSYFGGAWYELREVRWPTRRATWGLTIAVILFTLVLVAFILALDYGFEQLFKQVIL